MRLMSDDSYQICLIQGLAKVHVIPISRASAIARSERRRMEVSDQQETTTLMEVDENGDQIYSAHDFLV
jgi:hypothetical protein